jgi:hypothetical protein
MRQAGGLDWGHLFACILRPGIAAMSMGAVTATLSAADLGAWMTIVLATLLGGLTYAAVLYGLWRAAASPQAAGEAVLARRFWTLLARNAGRLRA